jgi:hypothetical protein
MSFALVLLMCLHGDAQDAALINMHSAVNAGSNLNMTAFSIATQRDEKDCARIEI